MHRVYSDEDVNNINVSPELLARIYAARGIQSDDELDYSLRNLISFSALSGIDKAIDILERVITDDLSIVIVGDYDVDGATSCTLCMRALRQFGGKRVNYLIPNRFDTGHGLSVELIEMIAVDPPDVIITVDNGISNIDGIAAAKNLGIITIITDHHLPGDYLPEADAIVNPNCNGDFFPSKNLAGVGVIFYVMMALRSRLRENSWFERKKIIEPNMACFLDLVALGTVADVVPLDRNNRILVSQGIARIRAGRACFGIQALLKIGKKDFGTVVSSDLGFIVGPRLNAAGRLKEMSIGVECLLADNFNDAFLHVKQLDVLNVQRKKIEAKMKDQAVSELENIYSEYSEDINSLCLYDENWHQGVVGILASRIKDRYNRPVAVFAESTSDDEIIRGSVRSVDGLHIRDVLDDINIESPGLLEKYGGHSMAAGLSIKKVDLTKFKQLFETHVGGLVDQENKIKKIITDGSLTADNLNLETALAIRDGGPWGQQFPEPLFDGEFTVIAHNIIGGKHIKLRLQPADDEVNIEAIAFNAIDKEYLPNMQKISAVFYLTVNEYRGNIKIQLIIDSFEVVL